MTAYIFCAGEKSLPDNLNSPPDFIICADAGINLCTDAGFSPNVIIGDFDSFPETKTSNYNNYNNCKKIRYPSRKDDTDSMLAIKYCIEKGYTDLIIFGGLGARTDHTIANIQALLFALEHGANAKLVSRDCEISLLAGGKYCFEKSDYDEYFSIFSFSPAVTGLNLLGFEYSGSNINLSQDFPLGISNEIKCNRAYLSFENGLLLVIRQRKIN